MDKEEQRRERVGYMHSRLESVARGYTFDVLIVGARYDGAYEGAKWLAWLAEPEWLDDYQSGDTACMEFYEDYSGAPIGRGDTPDAALADIKRQAREAYPAIVPEERD